VRRRRTHCFPVQANRGVQVDLGAPSRGSTLPSYDVANRIPVCTDTGRAVTSLINDGFQSTEDTSLGRGSAVLRQQRRLARGCFAVQMRPDSLSHRGVFNASNDLDLPRAPLAGLDLDVNNLANIS
jgi:hypothetical protein